MKIKKFILILLVMSLAVLSASLCGCDKKKEEASKKIIFTFTVYHKDGSTKDFKITTDKELVGEALEQEGIIAGEEGAYGLYVKTVDGETLDYNTDGYWWSFYVDGESSMTGVDKTKIENGKSYSFRAEKS